MGPFVAYQSYSDGKMAGTMTSSVLDLDRYSALLAEAKATVRNAQLRAHVAVNRELIGLYWQLGQLILSRQEVEGGYQGH